MSSTYLDPQLSTPLQPIQPGSTARHIIGHASASEPQPVLIKCKRCTFRGTIDNFPLKLNGTDRTTACLSCVMKNREESRAKRRREGVGQRMQSEGQSEHGLGEGDGSDGNATHSVDMAIPTPETTLASAEASTSLPGFPSAVASSSSPGASTRKDKTRRNVGRSAFPESHLSWYGFVRAIKVGPGESIDVHASVALGGVQMFQPYLNVQADQEGAEYVVVDGKREALDAAAWALARLVSREIWRITGYRYIYKSRSGSTGNPGRHNSHFHCAQNDNEKRAKRSRVNVQKKRMPRFDCGGYLNIVTDERDLTQVNVTLTHATPHTRYADRPEDVPLEETPWLLDTGGLDDHSNMVSVQGRGMVNVMEIGSHQPVPAHQHMSTGRNAVESSAPTHTLGQDLTSIAIDPNLQTAAHSTASNNVQASRSDPFLSVGSPATSAPLPYIMPLSSISTSRPVGNTLNQPLAPTTQPTSSSLEAGSSTSAPFALATNPAQGQSMNGGNTAGIDRVHITPEEYLKYQQAYQVILNQLASSEGMDAKRYEKVGSMLKWIEQVGKIFEQEKQGINGVGI
ncbi:hypothetical protein QFC20_001913 [Naganishia adeliensis]|uniref:Uncharacterized protein n=1 Tax=Naganishia adeliensis TaxID=92952 RepID=A0ACC2WR99_9TREE|nr:hypothetical protein QFC20_001913 [Naganishia adeliensis]